MRGGPLRFVPARSSPTRSTRSSRRVQRRRLPQSGRHGAATRWRDAGSRRRRRARAHSFLAGDLTAAQRWAVSAGGNAATEPRPSRGCSLVRAGAHVRDQSAGRRRRSAPSSRRLGEAQHRSGDPRARETLLSAAATARKVGAADVLVRAAMANDRGFSAPRVPDVAQLEVLDAAIAAVGSDDASTLARLLALRAQELVHTPEHELRLASARQALELLDRSDDPLLLPRMISALAFGLWGPDTFDVRRDLAMRAVEITSRISDPILEFTTNRAARSTSASSPPTSPWRGRPSSGSKPSPRRSASRACDGPVPASRPSRR